MEYMYYSAYRDRMEPNQQTCHSLTVRSLNKMARLGSLEYEMSSLGALRLELVPRDRSVQIPRMAR